MRLDKIKKNYNLHQDSLLEIKRKLKQILKEAHPDNNEGHYNKNEFEKINEDLEYIESEILKENMKKEITISSGDLLNIIQEPSFVEAFVKLNESDMMRDKLDKSIEKQSLKFTHQFKIRRYSLTSITALVSFLWLIPDKVREHPVFQYLFSLDKYNIFFGILLIFWLVLLIVTIIYWIYTLKLELVEKEILENVKNEDKQNDIFMNFVTIYNKDKAFSVQDFVRHLRWLIEYGIHHKRTKQIIVQSLSDEVLQNAAYIILKRAEQRKIIEKVDIKSLIDYYKKVEDI